MTLPKEVSEKIDALLKADQAYEEKVAWPGCNETEREEVQYAWDCAREDLSDAILSALSAAREGALREAAATLKRRVDRCRELKNHDRALAFEQSEKEILALASRPEPAAEPAGTCGYCHLPLKGSAEFCDLQCKALASRPEPEPNCPVCNGEQVSGPCRTCAPEPAPESLPCPVCDDGIEEACPRCARPARTDTEER